MAARNVVAAAGRENVAGARVAAGPCDHVEQPQCGLDAVIGRDHAEFGRADAVAANADVKRRPPRRCRGAKAHVGGNAVEVERAAAVDDDGDFGREPVRQRSSGQRIAQIGGERGGVQNFLGIETGERIAQNGNAVVRGDAERGDGIREKRRGLCAQPANLNAAARGDFDDAVAVLSRRGAKLHECAQARRCRSASAAPAIRRRSASAPKVRDRRRGGAR